MRLLNVLEIHFLSVVMRLARLDVYFVDLGTLVTCLVCQQIEAAHKGEVDICTNCFNGSPVSRHDLREAPPMAATPEMMTRHSFKEAVKLRCSP